MSGTTAIATRAVSPATARRPGQVPLRERRHLRRRGEGGVIVGRGTYVAKNGDVFEGSFADGKPHGMGVYRFASGDRYEGEMDQGRLQGRGTLLRKNGDRIEAPFVDGKAAGARHLSFRQRRPLRRRDHRRRADRAGRRTSTAPGLKYEGEVRRAAAGQGRVLVPGRQPLRGQSSRTGSPAHGARSSGPTAAAPAAEIVDGNARLLD